MYAILCDAKFMFPKLCLWIVVPWDLEEARKRRQSSHTSKFFEDGSSNEYVKKVQRGRYGCFLINQLIWKKGFEPEKVCVCVRYY